DVTSAWSMFSWRHLAPGFRGRHAELQDADHLPGIRYDLDEPTPDRIRWKVALVRPCPVALLATARDIERNAIHFPSLVNPDVVHALVQSQGSADGGIGEQAITAQIVNADLLDTFGRRTMPWVHLDGEGDLGHAQGGGRHPQSCHPARCRETQHQDDHDKL